MRPPTRSPRDAASAPRVDERHDHATVVDCRLKKKHFDVLLFVDHVSDTAVRAKVTEQLNPLICIRYTKPHAAGRSSRLLHLARITPSGTSVARDELA